MKVHAGKRSIISHWSIQFLDHILFFESYSLTLNSRTNLFLRGGGNVTPGYVQFHIVFCWLVSCLTLCISDYRSCERDQDKRASERAMRYSYYFSLHSMHRIFVYSFFDHTIFIYFMGHFSTASGVTMVSGNVDAPTL